MIVNERDVAGRNAPPSRLHVECSTLSALDGFRLESDAHAKPRAACQESAHIVAGVRLCVNNDTRFFFTGVQHEGSRRGFTTEVLLSVGRLRAVVRDAFLGAFRVDPANWRADPYWRSAEGGPRNTGLRVSDVLIVCYGRFPGHLLVALSHPQPAPVWDIMPIPVEIVPASEEGRNPWLPSSISNRRR